MFKVLSTDGGGIRGIIPAVLLDHIETETGKRVSESFDLIAATSTGGLLAAALAKPEPFCAKEIVSLYQKHGREIFQKPRWHHILHDEKYNHNRLEAVLEEYLVSSRLKDCKPPIIVTSYDIVKRKRFFFKTRNAKDEAQNYLLRDVGRATSAVRTFFEPKQLAPDRVLIDGGVVANNPGMCAYVEALKMSNRPEDIFIVSISCGDATREITYAQSKDWGVIQWALPLIIILLDGPNDAVNHQLREILGCRYYRLTGCLKSASDEYG